MVHLNLNVHDLECQNNTRIKHKTAEILKLKEVVVYKTQTNACMTTPFCSSISQTFIWIRQSSGNTWHVETLDIFKFAFFQQRLWQHVKQKSDPKEISFKRNIMFMYLQVPTNTKQHHKHKPKSTKHKTRPKRIKKIYISTKKESTSTAQLDLDKLIGFWMLKQPHPPGHTRLPSLQKRKGLRWNTLLKLNQYQTQPFSS